MQEIRIGDVVELLNASNDEMSKFYIYTDLGYKNANISIIKVGLVGLMSGILLDSKKWNKKDVKTIQDLEKQFAACGCKFENLGKMLASHKDIKQLFKSYFFTKKLIETQIKNA